MNEPINDLRQQCGECHGTGCSHCKGEGFTWKLTLPQMAQRIVALLEERKEDALLYETENALLRARVARLEAPLSPEEKRGTVKIPYGEGREKEAYITLVDLYGIIAARAAEPVAATAWNTRPADDAHTALVTKLCMALELAWFNDDSGMKIVEWADETFTEAEERLAGGDTPSDAWAKRAAEGVEL